MKTTFIITGLRSECDLSSSWCCSLQILMIIIIFIMAAVASLKDGGPVNRTQAQSLDSMFTVGTNMQGDVKMDLQKRRLSFPNECMHSLLSIIKALMLMEDHVDSLMHTITWDITALAPKKARRKASIRGKDHSHAVITNSHVVIQTLVHSFFRYK